jgi:hypothetical protein
MHTALCRPLQLLAQQRQVPAAAPVRPPLSQPCWGDLPTLIFLQGVRRASRPGPSKCDKEAAWDFSQLSTFCCPDPGECNENAAEYWGAPAEDRGGGGHLELEHFFFFPSPYHGWCRYLRNQIWLTHLGQSKGSCTAGSRFGLVGALP